jgi:predicted nucleic acid-binding protein
MAVVIADTSPVQYLFQVGLIDVLPGLFGTVHVPGRSATSSCRMHR